MRKDKPGLVHHCLVIDNRNESLWGIPSVIPQWVPIFGTIASKIVLGIGSFAVNWPIVGSVFLISAFWFTFVVWLVRRHRIAWMHCDDELHQLTHHLRDHLDGIQRCENPNALTLKVENCESAFADAVANYFAKRLHNDSCGCCIRLAAISDGLPGYVTRARSRSLGVGRRERSEPIFEDSSFVRMLKDKDSLGVWLLNDLKLASESKLWPDLKNNELMHFDSVMIAPVNTVIDNKKSMTGILFVTAKGRVFQPAHTTSLKAFADLLGTVLPLLYSLEVPIKQKQQTLNIEQIEQKANGVIER